MQTYPDIQRVWSLIKLLLLLLWGSFPGILDPKQKCWVSLITHKINIWNLERLFRIEGKLILWSWTTKVEGVKEYEAEDWKCDNWANLDSEDNLWCKGYKERFIYVHPLFIWPNGLFIYLIIIGGPSPPPCDWCTPPPPSGVLEIFECIFAAKVCIQNI